MKKKSLFLLFIIVFIALFVRLWGLDKPQGMWNDEYMTYFVASADFGKDFLGRMFNNAHMPLYYFFLKSWMFLFGESDLVLRLSSVFLGVLSVISMFFLGREFKDRKFGLFCSLFTALSSFLIYFSQEVRLYQLLFFVSVWILYFFVKSLKNPSRKNIGLYIFSNFLLLISHTISFVFVFFNIAVFSFLLFKEKPEYKKTVFISYAVLLVLFLPLLPFLISVLTRETMSQNWGIFNFSKVVFVFMDYFTPLQTNITNSPLNLINYFKSFETFWYPVVFVLLPFFIAVAAIIRAISIKDKTLNSALIISGLYFASLLAAAGMGKLVLSTKYSVEIFPSLILAFCAGLGSFKNVQVGRALAAVYFLIISYFIVFDESAPQKLPRKDGNKLPILLLRSAEVGRDDYIIPIYYEFFRYQKYSPFVPKNLLELTKNTAVGFVSGKEYPALQIKKEGKKLFYNNFSFRDEKYVTAKLDRYFQAVPKGRKIAVIVPLQAAFFSSGDLKRMTSSEAEYEGAPFMFMLFSYVKMKVINSAAKYGTLQGVYRDGDWAVVVFQK